MSEHSLLYVCAFVILRHLMYVFQVVERWSRGSEVVPSLYVFECVELELTLKLAPTEEEELVESDFTCPIRLHRGQEVSPPVILSSLLSKQVCRI